MGESAYHDNQHLAFTQEIRRGLVEQYTRDGKYPDDPKLLSILLSALKDYDRVTLTLKRIEADSENADADRQALAQFHRLSAMLGPKDISRVDTPIDPDQKGPSTPFDPADIPETPLVDGELMVGSHVLDYNEFMAEQTRLHKERLEKSN